MGDDVSPAPAPAIHDREGSPLYPGWRVLVASVVGLAFSPGPMIFGSFGLLASPLRQRFGWSLGQVMVSLTLFNIASVIMAPSTGQLIDRHGVRRVLFPSLVVFLCGFLALAYCVTSLLGLYALALAWGACTVATQSISYTKLLTAWFRRRRGLAIGIAAAGLGLGYSIVPLLVTDLLRELKWQTTLAVMAALIAVVPTGLNAAFAHDQPDALAESEEHSESGLSLAEARATPAFWYMAGAILLAAAALTGVVPHLPLIARERGLSGTEAAEVASTFGLATIVGRILVGALADRFAVSAIAMVFFGISTIGFVDAALIHSQPPLIGLSLAAVALGLGFGAETDVIALLISRHFGQRSFGAIYGFLLSAFLIGASAGPPLMGFGRDVLGSYRPLMLAAAAVMIGAVLLLARLGRASGEPDHRYASA